jgi:hypothetical protein
MRSEFYTIPDSQEDIWRNQNDWKVFEMTDTAIEMVKVAVGEALRPGTGQQWKVVNYSLDWGSRPEITFAATRGIQKNHQNMPFISVVCRCFTISRTLECFARNSARLNGLAAKHGSTR